MYEIRTVKMTHGYIWYLAKRLVLEIWWLLVLCHLKVDGNQLVMDVALFCNQGNAARGRRERGSIKFEECHVVKYCCIVYGRSPVFP